MPKIQIVVTPNSGISYHRLVNPVSYLDMGPDWNIELLWIGEDEGKIDCDILWYSKYIITEPRFLQKMQDKGMKIVVDIDDNWELPASHPRYKEWVETGRPQRTVENIRIANLVICSTMKVQEKVRAYNKNTVVIPNAFTYGHDVYQPGEQDNREKMSFIYSGGASHYNDLVLLQGKFQRIGSDVWMKQRSEYLLAGYVAQQQKHYLTPQDQKVQNNNYILEQGHGEWDKMASVFMSTNSYRILPSLDLDSYLNYYDLADVSLIPLQQTSWNSYKSILKVLEAATRKLPVICSKVQPYWPELKDYPGILWVENNNWLDHIRYCIKNPSAVKDMGEQLAEKIAQNYYLPTWNEARKELFESFIKR